jgi:NAD(P)-dependent dehydrogenase (short-subunit alcohol dehydrogenase family)
MTSLDADMNVSANTAAPAKTLALVIGAGGGMGAALVQALSIPGGHGIDSVLALGRATQPAIDYSDETSLQNAAAWVASQCQLQGAELRLVIVASGFLHGVQGQPERSWSHLDPDYLRQVFLVNAIGPALVMKHFLPLLPRQGRCVAGFVSAKVGSIGDNALGGWYGYRAAKAALNQLVKTAAIELKRRNPQALCVALHPGTVDTALSKPFTKAGLKLRPPEVAATELLTVLAGLEPAQTGALVDYQGKVLPW